MEAIGAMAGGIAHDFNNILFPISGLSELLLEDLSPESEEYDNAKRILKAAERGSDLVQQILAFSRQTDHRMMPLRLQQILKEALTLCRSTIPANIEIHQDIQKDCGPVTGDPTQVHQIAMNLITNAYRAVEENGGKISLRLTEIEFDDEHLPKPSLKAGRYAIISIQDTGYGITPENTEKIFEPYFTTKQKGKGTGIGLAVVYGIVKEYGGDIEVRSELGKGSTFNVYLPLMKEFAESKRTESQEKAPTGHERILLVDDEEPIIQIESQMLKRLGYTVTAFKRCGDALNAFGERPDDFDLVITDMAMPEMTGLELAGKLSSIRADIPIFLCTGFSERINEQSVRDVPIMGVLKKPVSKFEIAKKVRDVMAKTKK